MLQSFEPSIFAALLGITRSETLLLTNRVGRADWRGKEVGGLTSALVLATEKHFKRRFYLTKLWISLLVYKKWVIHESSLQA